MSWITLRDMRGLGLGALGGAAEDADKAAAVWEKRADSFRAAWKKLAAEPETPPDWDQIANLQARAKTARAEAEALRQQGKLAAAQAWDTQAAGFERAAQNLLPKPKKLTSRDLEEKGRLQKLEAEARKEAQKLRESAKKIRGETKKQAQKQQQLALATKDVSKAKQLALAKGGVPFQQSRLMLSRGDKAGAEEVAKKEAEEWKVEYKPGQVLAAISPYIQAAQEGAILGPMVLPGLPRLPGVVTPTTSRIATVGLIALGTALFVGMVYMVAD